MSVAMAVGRLRGDAAVLASGAVLEQVISSKGRLPVDLVINRPGAA